MRKLLIVALLVNAVLLAGRFWQELNAAAQIGGGVGAGAFCDGDATKYSLDTNDDGGIDVSDFVYGLSWFFNGTEAPRVCLAGAGLPTQEQLLILSKMSIEELDDGQGGTANTIRITGCNLQIVNGQSSTATTNGVGNLIVGYQELIGGGDDRTGSHNIVVGTRHNYSSAGGLVVGYENEISGSHSSVSGGRFNTASGQNSSVTGGEFNTASNSSASVSGGFNNTAAGDSSTVSGGTTLDTSTTNDHVP